MFDMLRFLERKRDGLPHEQGDLETFVERFASGKIPDYQASAWLMAVFHSGLDEGELREFTLALARSGRTVQFPGGFFTVDKHSTGGVGDKTTIPLVPLAAACGISVGKLSGPGLGFTGGTVDKLSSIPGFRTHLSLEEFVSQVERIGCAISGHSEDLAPAEGRFYALRDVTATVPSLPLICSSIVSKKMAGGAGAFVFDVKCGSGAFMKDYQHAEGLALALVNLSKSLGRKSLALVTDMDQPLGEWIGNAAEAAEAVHVLRGEGPEDVAQLTVSLAGAMVSLGRDVSREEGEAMAMKKLQRGDALEKFRELVAAQGGEAGVCDSPEEFLPLGVRRVLVPAPAGGIVERVDARAIGEGVKRLGGGRMSLGEPIDLSAAARILARKGMEVREGDPLLEIRFNDENKLNDAMPFFEAAFSLGDEAVGQRRLLLGTIR